tara:strand:+ start:1374 stop:1526 length:153 start_codon:yes stop_codon:yes gene_type:complete
MKIAPNPSGAITVCLLASAATYLGLIGWWPVSCVLSVWVGIEWMNMWEFK